MNRQFWLALIQSLLLSSFIDGTTRKKRVMFGFLGLEEHRDLLNSFRYYVLLAKYKPSSFLSLLNIDLQPRLDSVECGGSLLTPKIVQTAAHCVANRNPPVRSPYGYNVSYYRVRNVFEEPLYGYVGANILTNMLDWLEPEYYIFEQEARSISYVRRLPTFSDFGLVKMKESITESAPHASISYVPIYSENSITAFYHKAIQKEYTCLTVGHGAHICEENTETGKCDEDPEASVETLWGWRTLMNNFECKAITYGVEDKLPNFDYLSHATWVCSQTNRHDTILNKNLYNSGEGDSGGPIACNNVYFGIVQAVLPVDAISIYGPILKTVYANAREYREAFIQGFGDLDNQRLLAYKKFRPFFSSPSRSSSMHSTDNDVSNTSIAFTTTEKHIPLITLMIFVMTVLNLC